MSETKPKRPFNNNDFELVLSHTRAGLKLPQAAAAVQFSPQTIWRHLREDEEWRARYREAQADAKEILAESIRSKMVERAFDDQYPQTQRALEKVADWYVPEAKQTIEVTGGEQPIRVEVESTDDEAARILHVLAGAGLLALRAQASPDPETHALHPASTD